MQVMVFAPVIEFFHMRKLIFIFGNLKITNERNQVRIEGNLKGKTVTAVRELKGLGFYGAGFDLGVRALILGRLDKLPYAMVNVADPAFPVTEMELRRDGEASYRDQKAIKVHAGLTGALAMFWGADFLVDSEGRILQYKGNRGPGTPDLVNELDSIR